MPVSADLWGLPRVLRYAAVESSDFSGNLERRFSLYSLDGEQGDMKQDLSTLPDEELMWLVQKDKLDAFEVLARRYEKRFVNFLYRFVNNRSVAEDICQQALLRIYRNRKKYRNRGKCSTWMYTIAANLARDWLRKNKRFTFISLDKPVSENTEILDFYESAEPTSSKRLEDKELARMVQKAIDSLPKHQRMAVLLSHYDNLNYHEIANIMGCSKGTVKSRIFRAKSRLKVLLTDYIAGKQGEIADEMLEGDQTVTGIFGQ
jgi:RNA polymerase sigma-70 factor (ECF subfamily)